MDFQVIPHRENLPEGHTNKVFLLTDGWDDWFTYSTMYVVFYFDKAGEKHRIGEVKIGEFEMVADQRRPNIPDEFNELEEKFFSLGQDDSYYQTSGPNSPETQFLHAYYDDLTADRWLYAAILEGSPPGATFHVDPPEQWDDATSARVRRHFERLKLARLYASQAGRQLQNIRRSLSNIYEASGADVVSADLLERSLSCADVSLNSWDGALYEAASQSDWFCNGGFRA